MKLLVIAYDLPPLLQPQAIQIGRLLYHMPPEYKMYVVTSNDMRSKRDNVFYNDINKKFIDKISIKYDLFWAVAGILFRKLPDKYFIWQARAILKIIRKWGNVDFDCILTFACPISSSILGLWLKKYYNTRWIAFFSDPWADNPHFDYRGVIKKVNSSLEKKVFKAADTLVFASPEMQHEYINKYLFIKNKSTFIEHSYDPFIYKDYKKAENGKLILRYLGTFYGQRTAQPLLTAIKKLMDMKMLDSGDFSFEIIGNVSRTYKRRYEELLHRLKLHDVIKLKQPVTYLESLSLMQQSDALVLIDAQIDGSVFLPSKLIDYIGADRPIIGITPRNGASARVIKNVGGWLADPSSSEDIESILQQVITHYKQGTLAQFRPSANAKRDYLIDNNVQKVLTILQKGNDALYERNK